MDTDRQMHRQIDGWICRWIDCQKDGQIEGWIDRKMDRQKGGYIYGWRFIHLYLFGDLSIQISFCIYQAIIYVSIQLSIKLFFLPVSIFFLSIFIHQFIFSFYLYSSTYLSFLSICISPAIYHYSNRENHTQMKEFLCPSEFLVSCRFS